MFTIKSIVEIIAIIIMGGGLLGIFIERNKTGKGIGVRVIQFLAIIFLIPTILILALEKVIDNSTIAALIGAIVGYILSGIGSDENDKKSKKKSGTNSSSPKA
jgi:hypothetical protein